MLRHRIGSRKKSSQASQYRVGMYGAMAEAEFSVTSTWLVIRAASAPSAAPREESVTVDRNSAIAPTPSIDTEMKATAPSIRSSSSPGVSPEPDSDVAARLDAVTPPGVAATGCEPNSRVPATYAVSATSTTAVSTYTTTATSLAVSSRARPTGLASRYRSMPDPASPAMESPPMTATAIGRKTGSTIASAAAGYSDPLDSTSESRTGP